MNKKTKQLIKKIEIKQDTEDYHTLGVAFLPEHNTSKTFTLQFEHLGCIEVELTESGALLKPNFGETIHPSKYNPDGIDVSFSLNLTFLELVKKWLEFSGPNQVLKFLANMDSDEEFPQQEHANLLKNLEDIAKYINKLKSTVESMKGYSNYN